MSEFGPEWDALELRLRELAEFRRIAALLAWDQHTTMPRRGSDARARAIATIRVVQHERQTDPALGDLLQRIDTGRLDRPRAAMLRIARRDHDRAIRLPADLIRRLAFTASRGESAWELARPARDFGILQPFLTEMVALKREQADLMGHDGERYDALLDVFEPGLRAAYVAPLFELLAADLRRLLDAIAAAAPLPGVLNGRPHPAPGQWQFTMRVLADLGFDLDAGRQDRSAHPFSTTIALRDVRVTTRVDEADPFSAVFSTIHEAGHGMYDQGFDPAFEDTPLAEAPSLGAHESQSRLWENIVGRSLPFWEHYAPVMGELVGGSLAGAGAQDVFRHVNRVTPSLIRVEADEVTYNLHVLVRFELERALMREELSVAELPEAWNDAYMRRLGVRVPHDGDGVLQDVHWSEGLFGYFPTYALGNLYSAMLWRRISTDLPDIGADIGAGRFEPLLGWLRDHVHTPGYLYDTGELMLRATGSELTHEPFMDYLWEKFGPLYGVSGARA